MRTFGKWLGRGVLFVIVLGLALWNFGPYEPSGTEVSFDEGLLGNDVDAYLASREARFDDITPGVEKRVVWHGVRGEKTRQVLVYVHGFSASSEEIRPVPDRIASALGANLVYTRLQGHGRSDAAMAEATTEGWMRDVAEALAVARAVGEEVIILSTSTGGTLVAEAARQPALMQQVRGVIFVSPNFSINNPLAPLLTLPAARNWLPLVAGRTRSYEPRNDRQAIFWTTSYPTVAVLPMAALVERARSRDFAVIKLPALFWYSDADQVVVPAATDKVVARWGGPVTVMKVTLGAGSDPYAHVIAGAIASPSQTELTVAGMLSWIENL